MTSLAKQLERLSVPHTQSIYGEDKRRKSLLFEPKEAATLNKEDVYAIGINGFAEIVAIDSSFEEFELGLFGESTISFQRSIQTSDVNAQLDETINSFLQRLSPYCLLKPAHKVLEWLIYRFDIDVYNIDQFMMCLLPFHESNIFVRAVQLLKLSSKTATKWDWLQPLQKSGVHLPRQTLINHCISNIGFLSFICDMIYKTVKVNSALDKAGSLRAVHSFYMSLVIGVLEFSEVTENIVSTLLPHISHGMRSKVVEYRAATYMILSQLVCRAHLKEDLLKTFISAIFKKPCVKLEKEIITCTALVFQRQNISSLPNRSLKRLCRHPGLVEQLRLLSTTCSCEKLTEAFLDKLVVVAVQHNVDVSQSESSDTEAITSTPRYLNILHDFLSSVPLSTQIADNVTRKIIENYVVCANGIENEEELEEIGEKHRKTVQLLEKRYPESLDQAVKYILDSAEVESVKTAVQDFLNLSVLSLEHQHLSDMDGSLTLSLNHRTHSIRANAVCFLLQNLEKSEATYISDVLMARLADESPDVVKAVLEADTKLWTLVQDKVELCQCLGAIMIRTGDWREVIMKAVRILCSCEPQLHPTVLVLLFPWLLLSSTKELKFLKIIFESDMAKNNNVIEYVTQKFKKELASAIKKSSTADFGKLSVDLTHIFASAITASRDWKELLMTIWDGCSGMRYKCQLSLLLNAIIPQMTDIKDKVHWCGKQLRLIHQLNTARKEADDMVENLSKIVSDSCESIIKSQTVPPKFSIALLKELVTKIPHPVIDEEFWDFTDDSLLLLVGMFDYLVAMSCGVVNRTHYRRLVLQLLENFRVSKKLKFLGLLWTQHTNDKSGQLGIPVSLQIQALQIGKQLLHEDLNIVDLNTVVFNLVLTLSSNYSAIRQISIVCLNALKEKASEKKSEFSLLIKKIVKYEAEVVSDPNYILQLMASSLTTETKKGKRKSQIGRRQGLQKIIIDILQRHATPQYMRHAILQTVSLHNTEDFLCDLLPVFDDLMAHLSEVKSSVVFDSCRLIIQRFTEETCGILQPESRTLKLILKALNCQDNNGQDSQTLQEVMMSQLTDNIYSTLPGEVQHQILSSLFDVWLNTKEPSTVKILRKTLKHFTLQSGHVVEELNKCLQSSGQAATVKEHKRQKRKSVMKLNPDEDVFEQASWQQVVIILEVIQTKKKIRDYIQLLPTVFQILSVIVESDQHASAEYIKQLLLSVVGEVSGRAIKHGEIAEFKANSSFNIDLIVNTIRASSNPQTHHKALLVLSVAAQMFPEDLLHKVMSVFTFMGANIMRQDDEYSFHVINRILETVVPALITACEQRGSDAKGQTKEDVITMVIQVFVDAYTHMPQHRRLMLFSRLIEIVGGASFLWRCLLLKTTKAIIKPVPETSELITCNLPTLLYGFVTHDNSLMTEQEEEAELQFDMNLLANFSVITQISSVAAMITYVSQLPADKAPETMQTSKTKRRSVKPLREEIKIFDLENHSAKQLRHFKYRAFKLLVAWCGNQALISQLSDNSEEDLSSSFQHLVQTILMYVSHLSQISTAMEDPSAAKFYRALSHKVYDLLDKVVGLLPEEMLVQVIKDLMDHSIPNIKRKAMELLNTNLLQKESVAKESNLLGVVDKLTQLATNSEEEITTVQTALYSLKLLCRRLGSGCPHTFIKVLKISMDIFTQTSSNPALLASALLCIAEICSCLKAHVIAHLSTFMPLVISYLHSNQLYLTNELFLLSLITTIQKVVENLSLFLSPYLQDIITQICHLSGKKDELVQKVTIQHKLKAIRYTIATNVPPRVLLNALPHCYENLMNSHTHGIQPLVVLLTDHVNNMSKEDLNSHIQQLQVFYLTCLDLRQHCQEDILETEGSVIEAIVTMVMKLSESTFRPMFYKIFDWATRDEEFKERILVFYRLADCLAEKMQSLFTIFAGHIVVHAAQVLKENNQILTGSFYYGKSKEGKQNSHHLLVYVCGCLYKCFLYDTEGFVTKDRFDTLLQPLVDQLENVDGKPLSRQRVTEYVIPCIAQFAAATQDDSMWKSLNYQILLKTRHTLPEVRFVALMAVDQLHKKLADDYMPLLPETIPFLAELMEDEEEEVENQCQVVISEMEKTLGEPLQKYF